MKDQPARPVDIHGSLRKELRAFETEQLHSALQEAAKLDGASWETVKADPLKFLRSKGISLAEGIRVTFEDRPIHEPPPIDFGKLGIIGWRCFKWCGIDSSAKPPIMRCEDLCLPLFGSRLPR